MNRQLKFNQNFKITSLTRPKSVERTNRGTVIEKKQPAGKIESKIKESENNQKRKFNKTMDNNYFTSTYK